MKSRYQGRGLTVVGVHTPEFEHERRIEAVQEAVASHQLDHPHLLDNDSAYWKALGNQYWPTTYLVDKCGRIRVTQIGEVHADRESGRVLERQLQTILDEASACAPGAATSNPRRAP